jgi:hypothetical protein
MGDRKFSTYLFPEPSALHGVARLLDLGVQLDSYNVSLTEAIADAIAIHCDWLAVGQDLRGAMKAKDAELKQAA